MNVAVFFIIVYIATIMILILIPKRGFHHLIRRDMDKDFKPEEKGFVYRGVGYWRMVILGGGMIALALTFLVKFIFY